jgi:predicted AlkP superfamily pyrophosphatase or phosphodiesterase
MKALEFRFVALALLCMAGCVPPTPSTSRSATAASAPTPAANAPADSQIGDSTSAAPRRSAQRATRLVDAIDRVLIISIDGLRPDLLLRAAMPRVRALCASGSFTFWAETAPEAYTLPCHLSMLTGVSSEKHGVTWNDYIEEAYPNAPTLFELAKELGYTTALATGKMKFITLLKPRAGDDLYASESSSPGEPAAGEEPMLLFQQPAFQRANTVDYYYLPAVEPVSDVEVAAEAVRLLRDYWPDLFFVHFPGVDTAGHEHGWGTSQQLAAIEEADAAVGQVLDVLAELDRTDSTLVLVTADHGGAGTDHKAGDPRSHFIPWVASGPGIRGDFDLTLIQRSIRIEDTFATACAFLGIALDPDCEGRPVIEIINDGDLSSVEHAEGS